jgi:hypothetical protein
MSPQLLLFACPFGGCDDDGYCACLEEDVEAFDDLDDEGLDVLLDRHGRVRRIETVPISIDDYQPTPATDDGRHSA